MKKTIEYKTVHIDLRVDEHARRVRIKDVEDFLTDAKGEGADFIYLDIDINYDGYGFDSIELMAEKEVIESDEEYRKREILRLKEEIEEGIREKNEAENRERVQLAMLKKKYDK